MELDHVAVSGEDLAAAAAHVEGALGVALAPGGQHAVFHTHNRLLGLADGLYLEAIAVDQQAPAPDRPRWFDLDRFAGPPRLTNWICRCDDLDATLSALPGGFGRPVALQRGDLRWRMAVPATGVLPFDNCAPALIEWQTDTHPASRLPASGCRLTALSVRHPEAAALAQLLRPHIADPRLSFEAGAPALVARVETPDGPRELS